MASRTLAAALLASGVLPTALAWGAMGHQSVAYVATNFVAPQTKTYFQTLLNDTSADYLAGVASWADSYRYTTEGAFTAQFHYIDALDAPPHDCGVDYERDCGPGGCIISAIQNYTSRILTPSLDLANRQIAAKMIIHLVGDIGQPLHCENLEIGGNGISVKYNGSTTNLHSVWDSGLTNSIAGGSSMAVAQSFGARLSAAIASGSYKSLAAGWVSGISLKGIESAMTWATESNAAVCTTVLAKGEDWVRANDLATAGNYLQDATPVIETQIAKQGYRLAKYLDAIVVKINQIQKCSTRAAKAIQ